MKPNQFGSAARATGVGARNVQRDALTSDDQGSEPDADSYVSADPATLPDLVLPPESQSDYALARRAGETEERRRRRLEGEPWDHADPDGPEDGA
ncbi:hypothetical protein WSS_A09207 [Rhodococcus opacus M213]|nr:hypothetical protein WSS_A09207 [Rhodococcus opacus M213]